MKPNNPEKDLLSSSLSRPSPINYNDPHCSEKTIQSICDSLITSLCIEMACNIHHMAKTGAIPYSEIMIPKGPFEALTTSDNNDTSHPSSRSSPSLPGLNEETKTTENKSNVQKNGNGCINGDSMTTTNGSGNGDDGDDDDRRQTKKMKMTTTTLNNDKSNTNSTETNAHDNDNNKDNVNNIIGGDNNSTAVTPSPSKDKPSTPLSSSSTFKNSSDGDNGSSSITTTACTTIAPPPLSTGIATFQNQTKGGSDIWGRHPPKEPKTHPSCPVCGRSVSATRFAPHLDKCMGLSQRSSLRDG